MKIFSSFGSLQTFALAVFMIGTLCSSEAGAGIVKGPHLQNVTVDGVTIVWQQASTGTAMVEVNGFDFAGVGELVKEARITGLSPASTYEYTVFADGDTFVAELSTAPADPSTPFVFLVGGDTRSLHDDHQAVVNQMLNEADADLIVSTGDMVNAGGSDDDWQSFFNIEAELIARTPWYPTVGNHELSASHLPNLYFEYLAPPTDTSGTEAYYSFKYANSGFVILDGHANVTENVDDYWTDFDMLQHAWLERVLSELDAEDSVQHIFVFAHVPPFSSKPGRSGSHALRLLLPVFEEHGVDAVFSGHDHYLERGLSPDGVRYFVSGGGGAPLYVNESVDNLGDKSASALPWMDDAHTVDFAAVINGYVRVEVNGGDVVARFKDSSGVVVDSAAWSTEIQAAGDAGIDAGQDAGSDVDADIDTDSDISDDPDAASDTDRDSGNDVDTGTDTDTATSADPAADSDSESDRGLANEAGTPNPPDLRAISSGSCSCHLVGA